MPIDVVTTEPHHTLDALHTAVRRAHTDDPLAPVTVIVPTNATGVVARRALGRRGGVVGVDMVTLNRVAELVAGPRLAASGRLPSSTPVVDLAVGQALERLDTAFSSVRDHPSTVAALRDLHLELRTAAPDAGARLAAHSRRGAAAAAVSAEVESTLRAAWYDEGDLFDEAVRSIDRLPDSAWVVYLPSDLRGRRGRLLQAIAERTRVTVVLDAPGGRVDPGVATALAAIVPQPAPVDPQSSRPPLGRASAHDDIVGAGTPAAIVTTTDADDEVRHAVRRLVDWARAGVPLERMAILWPAHVPYARLVDHHLSANDIVWNGHSGSSIAERRVPRLVLDLLDLDRRGLDRPPLFDLLVDVAPLDADGFRYPTARWERLTRYAGIVREDDWQRRLPRLRDHERYGADAVALGEFVERVKTALGSRHTRRRWAEWADWCDEQVEAWLGRRGLARLDDVEFRAWESLGKAVERLRHLDEIDGPVTRARFATMLEAELDAAPARRGRVGTGVFVGSLAGATGLELDRAVVLGGCEGSMPPAPRTDPLLSDADRTAAGLTASTRHAELLEHRFHALLRSAEVVVTAPRGDLRAGAERPLSRWLAPWRDDPRRLGPHDVASHVAGLREAAFPAGPSEHRLRTLLTAMADGQQIADHPAARNDRVLARGLAMRAARRTTTLTTYDGDLSDVDLPTVTSAAASTVTDVSLSPTHLEQWMACPHGYFVRYLLGVQPIEEPSVLTTIAPADRGSALHDTLEQLHRAVIDGQLPQPTGGWTDDHVAFALERFDAVAAAYERRGRTGRVADWVNERAAMRAELAEWLMRDSPWLAARGAVVVGAETDLAELGTPRVDLGDGRTLLLRGRIDRVIETSSGTVVVTDFKTGRADAFTKIGNDDPTLGHTHFQLAAYALARRSAPASAAHPADPTVHSEYAMFEKGNYRRYGFDLDATTEPLVTESFAHVIDGIESGLFPARPERPGFRMYVSCHYCDPDGLGTAERWTEWERKRHDPRLQRWFGEQPATDGAS